MTLTTYKSLWGMTGPLDAEIGRIKDAGYDGVESAAQECTEPDELKQLLREHHLKYIALVYTEGADHLEHLRVVVANAMQFDPIKIVAHGGRDTMSYVKQVRFFEGALRLEEEFGVTIAHETHRRRPLFSPMNTLALLRELPELKLNIDYSHWCCVTESMLEDHAEAIALSATKAVHLHGRVGYENGPQVPDPRVAEWERCVTKHEAWWEMIIREHINREEKDFSFTPEYGPPTYMQTSPNSGAAVSDLWDVCLWTAERFRKQFGRVTSAQ